MKREHGMALKSFLKNRDYNEASKSLKSLYGEYKGWDHFIEQARGWGFKWSQIHFLKQLCITYNIEESLELKLLILHLLYQYELGNLRTSIDSISSGMGEWYTDYSEDEKIDVDEIIQSVPHLFGSDHQPFLIVDRTIYINRIKQYEEKFLDLLKERIEYEPSHSVVLNDVYKYIEDSSPYGLNDLGREIIKKAIESPFLIISGGPGTGKTTTVVSIIRALKYIGLEHIAIAAPTGRAAQRVVESITRDTGDNEAEWEAFTLHKLLGIIPGQDRPRYSGERVLPMDAVIVDEASMVDIHMMYRLFDALAPKTKLILVGDKDQLPSVEAGALLGDFLFNFNSPGHKMKDSIVLLNRSFRSIKGIMDGAKKVIAGDIEGSIEYFRGGAEEITLHALPESDDVIRFILKELHLPHSSGFTVPLSEKERVLEDIEVYFKTFQSITTLTPTRKGQHGTWYINSALKREFCHDFSEFYHGQPIMITKNDYINSLYNGDRGVVFQFSNGLYALFSQGDGYRAISVSKLSDFETSYAGTVHKSQGSEYDRVIFIVPEGSERLLTREIIYTALTRAKREVVIFANDEELKVAISRVISRESGIRDFLMN